jgi:hypothetical protein
VDLFGDEKAAAIFHSPAVHMGLTDGLACVEVGMLDLTLALEEDVVALGDADLLGRFERLSFVHRSAWGRRR